MYIQKYALKKKEKQMLKTIRIKDTYVVTSIFPPEGEYVKNTAFINIENWTDWA